MIDWKKEAQRIQGITDHKEISNAINDIHKNVASIRVQLDYPAPTATEEWKRKAKKALVGHRNLLNIAHQRQNHILRKAHPVYHKLVEKRQQILKQLRESNHLQRQQLESDKHRRSAATKAAKQLRLYGEDAAFRNAAGKILSDSDMKKIQDLMDLEQKENLLNYFKDAGFIHDEKPSGTVSAGECHE